MRTRRARGAVLAVVSLVLLAGCQWVGGSSATLASNFQTAGGVSFQAASGPFAGGQVTLGTASYSQSQRVLGSPLPVFETNTFTGNATCVAVSGRLATVIFQTDLSKSTVAFGGPPAAAYVIEVERAAPGDPGYRWLAQPFTGDLTTCAPPTPADVSAMAVDNTGGTFGVGTS